MKSCYDCLQLKAKIPLIKQKGSLCNSAGSKCQLLRKKLDYQNATGRCKLGLLSKEKDVVFKHVLTTGRKLKAYTKAEICPNYDGEE